MILKTAPTHHDSRVSILECASQLNCSIVVCNTEQQRELVREQYQRNRIREAEGLPLNVQIHTFKQLMEGVARGKFATEEVVLVRDMEELMDCFLHVYGIKVDLGTEPCQYQVV